MKVLVKARILKLWLLIKAEIQLIQKFPRISFGIQFIKMLNLTLSLVKIVRKQGDLKLKANSKLHGIAVPSNVVKQVDVDLCGLLEVDGYRYLIVCIDYFSKRSEAKPITDKTAPTIA